MDVPVFPACSSDRPGFDPGRVASVQPG